MKRLTLSAVVIALPLLSACVVEQPPQYRYAPRHVVVHQHRHDHHPDHHRYRYHCPPGQAKKGNC